jgi:hypothetical protein
MGTPIITNTELANAVALVTARDGAAPLNWIAHPDTWRALGRAWGMIPWQDTGNERIAFLGYPVQLDDTHTRDTLTLVGVRGTRVILTESSQESPR